MRFWWVTILAPVSCVNAWLPGQHKQILSRDGLDLFDRRSLWEAGRLTKRFLPNQYGNDKAKIRGVNLGALFVLENWLADDVMSGWGCTSVSEFDCVSSLHDQNKANSDFQHHWQTWVDATDFARMVAYGLNTVRIPVGYWFYESIVDPSEHFPQGGEAYLDKVIGYAKDAGLYVIIDLHGAPGAQVTNPYTGQSELNEPILLPQALISKQITLILAFTMTTTTDGPFNSSNGSRRRFIPTAAIPPLV